MVIEKDSGGTVQGSVGLGYKSDLAWVFSPDKNTSLVGFSGEYSFEMIGEKVLVIGYFKGAISYMY